MPNHITNIMTVSGEETRVQECLNAIAGDTTPIDFNKIIPRPAALDITSGNLASYLENQFTMQQSVKHMRDALIAADDKSIEEFLQAVRNLRTYGHPTWYSWSCENWGTKWNAYEAGRDGNTIQFDTAWASPDPIFKKLGELYTDLTFTVEYADEDIGSNCGTIVVQGDSFTDTPPEDPDAFARRVKGYADEEEEVAA